MGKLLSGRYLLTLAAAFCFIWVTVRSVITPAEAIAVIMFVFQAYFNKNDRNTPTKGA